jgi:hypothetical protein
MEARRGTEAVQSADCFGPVVVCLSVRTGGALGWGGMRRDRRTIEIANFRFEISEQGNGTVKGNPPFAKGGRRTGHPKIQRQFQRPIQKQIQRQNHKQEKKTTR